MTHIDCEEALGRLFEFLDHELDAAEQDAVERHLQTCRSCFSRAGFERRLKGKLRDLRAPDAASERVESLLRNF